MLVAELKLLRRQLFVKGDYTRLADMAGKDFRTLRKMYRQRSVTSDSLLHDVIDAADAVTRATVREFSDYCKIIGPGVVREFSDHKPV